MDDSDTIGDLFKTSNNIDIQTINQLLESHGQININKEFGSRGETLLHDAAYHNHINIVKYLVSVASDESGANINKPDADKYTPLHRAAMVGNLEIVKYLVEHGANIHALGPMVNTPLHDAADPWTVNGCGYNDAKLHKHIQPCRLGHNNLETIKYLVEAGANIHAVNDEGNTPLHLAAKHNMEMTKYLLDMGSNKELKNRYGRNCEQVAIVYDERYDIGEYVRLYEFAVPAKGVNCDL